MASPQPLKLTATTAAPATPKAQPFALTGSTQVANISTADGSDAATTQALANATKTKINALLVALRNAGIIVP